MPVVLAGRIACVETARLDPDGLEAAADALGLALDREARRGTPVAERMAEVRRAVAGLPVRVVER